MRIHKLSHDGNGVNDGKISTIMGNYMAMKSQICRTCARTCQLHIAASWKFPSLCHWIGFVGKILTGNPWVFTIKLFGLKPVKIFPSSNSMIMWRPCQIAIDCVIYWVTTRNTNVLHIKGNFFWHSACRKLAANPRSWTQHLPTEGQHPKPERTLLCQSLGVSSNISAFGSSSPPASQKSSGQPPLCSTAATTEFWLRRIDCTWHFSKSNQLTGQQWKRGNGCQLCDNTSNIIRSTLDSPSIALFCGIAVYIYMIIYI